MCTYGAQEQAMAATSSSKLISPTHPSLNLFHPTLDSFAWNTLIRSSSTEAHSSLSLYLRMLRHSVRPDRYTFPFLLPSLSSPPHLPSARRLHAHALLLGLADHPFVLTSLLSAYSRCGARDVSRLLFRHSPSAHDVPSWNSFLSSILNSGDVGGARKVFDEMPQRNTVSWTTMIDGLNKSGDPRAAIQLFRDMQRGGGSTAQPNHFTMSAVLAACAQTGALELGEWAHAYIARRRIPVGPVLATALIDMYSKCGNIAMARQMFDRLGPSARDVAAWTAIISGLAAHGLARDSLALFEEMTVAPNAVTFLGVLLGCVHGGLVDEGKKYFHRMNGEFGIAPSIEHHGCMVDLYARAGQMEKAWEVVKAMPMKPDVLVWGALLSGCRTRGEVKMAEDSIEQLVELEPTNSGAYVLLSNAYAKLGRWDDVRKVRDRMDGLGISKSPGCSLIELDGHVHEFFAGDRSHPEAQTIYGMVDEMMEKVRSEGHVTRAEEVLLDLDEEGKEMALSVHSERLAIAFGLVRTRPGTTIRIVKNLRICVDCHEVVKLISKVYGREVVVRDCSRFHRFRGGFCTCKDYW